MELVYTVTKPNRRSRPEWSLKEDTSLVALSSKNTLAVCTIANLDDLDRDRCIVEAVYKVYVCDIDKPWIIHRLMTSADSIISVEWHHSGLKLLVATAQGVCYIYQMKDYALNSWHEPSIARMKVEEIVIACWLNPGGQMRYATDKNDSSLFSDKLIKCSSRPSLSHFGGLPVDGVFVVTSTGMVAVITTPTQHGISSGGNTASQGGSVQMTSLSASRGLVRVADVAFSNDGDILVATNSGSVTSAIQNHRVSLQANLSFTTKCSDSLTITCKPATSFYAKCHLDRENAPTLCTTQVRYMERDSSGETMIVAAGNARQSFVELWVLTNQPITLLRNWRNQGSDTNGSTNCMIQKWVLQSTISYSSLPMSIAVPRFPVHSSSSNGAKIFEGGPGSAGSGSSADGSSLFQYIAIAYRDGSVKLVHRRTFQTMTTTNLDTGITDLKSSGMWEGGEEEVGGEKRRKTIAYMTNMQQSFTGCVLVGVDQYSCVYVMKAVNTRDPVTQVPVGFLVGMLEYLMVAKLDCWDCLTAIKPGMVESVIARLSDQFNKQSTIVQDYLYSSLLMQKISLYKLSATSSGQLRASDCHCRLLLHSISNYFKSLLRPKVLSANDVSPADRLTMSCNTNSDLDLDAVVMSLNPEKKFVVEAPTLQSMQPFIQWVADLALHLIGIVSTLVGGSGGSLSGAANYPGLSLLRDARCLFTLRELLVVIRTWGLISTSCLPRFNCIAQNFDCLSLMFKCITKIWQVAIGGGNTSGRNVRDFDDGLIDECYTFISQIHLPPVDEALFGNIPDANYSQMLFTQNFPLKYVFGERPLHTYKSLNNNDQSSISRSDIALLPGQILSSYTKDVVRLIGLGSMYSHYSASLTTSHSDSRSGSESKDEAMRVCLRCGCRSLANRIARLPAAKVWELRFERSCLCGGMWRLEHLGSAGR